MQPSINPPDLMQLHLARETFTTRGKLISKLDPLVALSWKRSVPRLSPSGAPQWAYVSDEVLPLTLQQHAPLLALARPIMEDIHQFIEGAGALLILTDSTNCVLELLGDAPIMEYVTRLGLKQGAFLDESRIGTNAFAVALLESSPVQVVGAEHFLAYFHALSTVAAPIYDIEGHPVGVIGLAQKVEQHNAHSLGLVMAAAKAIENMLCANLFVREANAHASELNATLDAISDGVLAWNRQGIIMHLNDQAGQLFGLTPNLVVGRPLIEFITLPASLTRAAALGEELRDVETSLGVGGAPRECLVSLRVIRNPDGEPTAYIATLRRIDQVHQLVTRLVGAQARLTLEDIIGHGPAARRVRRQALTAANAKGSVLLIGEAGTSKNALARAIHNSGKRAGGPFLAINCRAIPRDLVLGEFLGFEPGAFNSAPSTGQPSKFELAHGGTLFLDEVEALPLEMQAALAHVIEFGEVIRLGGTRVMPVDARVMASTEIDLESRLTELTFRRDLFFRLSTFVIHLPPVRERAEDIPLLIEHLLEKLSSQFRRVLKISPAARAILVAYSWPGNITELEAVIERAALHCEGDLIKPEHLPATVRERKVQLTRKGMMETVRSLSEIEQSAILAAGRAARGNLSSTAKTLGIGRTTLWRKMKSLGLSAEDFVRE